VAGEGEWEGERKGGDARTLDGGGVDVGVLGGGVVAPDDGAGHVLLRYGYGYG
jgi:hypothetical protein